MIYISYNYYSKKPRKGVVDDEEFSTIQQKRDRPSGNEF